MAGVAAVLLPTGCGHKRSSSSTSPATVQRALAHSPDLGSGSGFDVDQSDGLAAWSRRASGGYRLILKRRGGRPYAPPIPPAAFPFDVDLGTDARGHAVATYSRCPARLDDDVFVREPCALYALDIAGERERLLRRPAEGASLARPAMRRGVLVFARVRSGRDAPAEILVAKPGEPLEQIAALPAYGVEGVLGMDLERGRVAVALRDPHEAGGTRLLTGPLIGPLRPVAVGGAGQENDEVVTSPSIAGHFLYWAFSNRNGLYHPRNGFVVRRDLRTGRVTARKTPGFLAGVAADAARPSAPLLIVSDDNADRGLRAFGRQRLARVGPRGFRDPPPGLGLRNSSGLYDP
jgi:hypothetical protein